MESEEIEDVDPSYYFRDQVTESDLEVDEEDLGYHSGATSTKFFSEDESEERESLGNEVEERSIIQKLPTKQPTEHRISKSVTEEPLRIVPSTVDDRPNDTESVEGESYSVHEELMNTTGHEELPKEILNNVLNALPKGCAPSLLYSLTKQGKHKLSYILEPSLNNSGILFEDLLPNQGYNGLRVNAIGAKSFKVTVLQVRNITNPDRVEVVTRRVRICLYDSTLTNPYLSNVHVLNAQWFPNDPFSWKFPSERGILVPRRDENSFMVRTTYSGPNLSLLFELCLYIRVRNGNNEEMIEVGSGWCKLPLWKSPKQRIIEFMQHDLKINGGNPLQTNVELESPNAIKTSIFGKKEQTPIFSIRISKLAREEIETQSNLPNNIVTSLSTMYLASYYREALAEKLIYPIDKAYKIPLPISDPVLSGFLKIINSSDVLEIFKGIFYLKMKVLKRGQRDDVKFRYKLFCKTVLETTPLLYIHGLPQEKSISKERLNILRNYSSIVKWEDKLMSNTFTYKPFTVNEILCDPPSYI